MSQPRRASTQGDWDSSHSIQSDHWKAKNGQQNRQPTFKVLNTRKNMDHLETLRQQETLGPVKGQQQKQIPENHPTKGPRHGVPQEKKPSEIMHHIFDEWFTGVNNDWALRNEQTNVFEAILDEIEEPEVKGSLARAPSMIKDLEGLEKRKEYWSGAKSGQKSFVLEHAATPLSVLEALANMTDPPSAREAKSEEKRSNTASLNYISNLAKAGQNPPKQGTVQYPPGFTAEDDLNNDGRIDKLEYQIKVQTLKEGILNEMDNVVRNEYLRKFQKEVDFHHKVAFRFEKSYRLGRKQPEKLKTLNMEIIDIISDHSAYLQQDTMALFYCLFFCIYFNNQYIVEFIRSLFYKLNRQQALNPSQLDRVDDLLGLIDMNGIERLRLPGDNTNIRLYHMIFYQAVDDKLRIVYSKIIRKLKAIQLRDKDGRELLNTRDYELIRELFTKHTLKLDCNGLGETDSMQFISRSYKMYNPAYFEEVLLMEQVEERVARNYRERFIVDQHAIYQVLQMYSKMDYLDHFLAVDVSALDHRQILDLFLICWKYDSFKIALHLYLTYLSVQDITRDLMDKFIDSLKSSVKFHEIKLFFIHEHFDVLDILQLNRLVDVLQDSFHRKEIKMNPMVNQYNTVKVSLLVYRVSWRIQKKKIYSLITGCQILNKYIISSLLKYLETFNNVSQLYEFMREPVLDLDREKDSLDIMLEMDMEEVLNHPVILEVLNLVYEGQYSVDSQPLYLSQTFSTFFQMDTFDMKKITGRLLGNIRTLGQHQSDKKQTSLQFSIWKYCLEQRMMDEVHFSLFISCFYLYYVYHLARVLYSLRELMTVVYGSEVVTQIHLLFSGDPKLSLALCMIQRTNAPLEFEGYLDNIEICQVIILIGIGTQLLQKLIKLRVKENCHLNMDEVILEILTAITSSWYLLRYRNGETNDVMLDVCRGVVETTAQQDAYMKKHMNLIFDVGSWKSYPMIIGYSTLAICFHSILLLRRSSVFQYIIVMFQRMVTELGVVFSFFGVLILMFMVVLRLLNDYLQMGDRGIYRTLKDGFNGFNNIVEEEKFTESGEVYMTVFQYISRVFFMGFLGTIFVLQYVKVSKSFEADKRKDIIRLKNVINYDSVYGAITMTFFPINVVLLPFVVPLLIMKSERLSDSILKLQYLVLIILYIIAGAALAIPVIPLLYIKAILNAAYFGLKNKRARYRGEGIVCFFGALILGPLLITGSLLTDFLALNLALMKDEKFFEYKYQNQDRFHGMNKLQITKQFIKLFIRDYSKKWKGFSQEKEELRKMKMKQFRILDNFHSFFCRGDKSYADSMANIRVFNLTKALANQAALPNAEGFNKRGVVEYDLVSHLFQDLIIYNFYERLVSDHRRGKETAEGQVILYAYPHYDYDLARHTKCSSWNRKIGEVFNCLSVASIVKAYTDIDEEIRAYQEEIDFFNSKRRLLQMEKMEGDWIREVRTRADMSMEMLYLKLMVFESEKKAAIRRKKNEAIRDQRRKTFGKGASRFNEFFTADTMVEN